MRDRLPAPRDEDMSSRQRHIVGEIRSGPRGELVGPFTALLRSPDLCERLARVGEFIRYESVVANRHIELVILCTARHWHQDFEWGYHLPIALSEGVPVGTTDAIAAAREPDHADTEAAAVWRLASELLHRRQVSDGVYAEVTALLGEEQVVELAATVGYYTTLAFVMNTALTPPPRGAKRLPVS